MFVNTFKITNAEHFTPEFLNQFSHLDKLLEKYYKLLNKLDEMKIYTNHSGRAYLKLKIERMLEKITQEIQILEFDNENLKFTNLEKLLNPEHHKDI